MSLLTELEFQAGVVRIRQAAEAADVDGLSLELRADLKLYVTIGGVPPLYRG